MTVFVNVIVPSDVATAAIDRAVQACQAYLEAYGKLTCERLGAFVQRNAEGVQHLMMWRPASKEQTADKIDLKDLESIMKTTLRAMRVDDATIRVSASVDETKSIALPVSTRDPGAMAD